MSGDSVMTSIASFQEAGGGSIPTTAAGQVGIAGGCPNPSIGPDVIVGDLNGITMFGTVGDITAYAIGTTSCNIGDADLQWVQNTNNHPVIAQNVYRLKDGRFEQIGMSWLKHGFCAADSPTCEPCSTDGNCDTLQIGCSDVYGSSINGNSIFLGPRSEVNPSTGAFPFPFSLPGGNNAGRLQVDINDLDPDLNPGAL